ncbi:MAG: dUTP diphosphatase [Proteobacteria bacterium]|nr:dUTP diphosphatase [Pseudomonadota bacterium]
MNTPSPNRANLGLKRLPHAQDLPLPAYQSADAAGFDLAAAIAENAPLTLNPGARALVPTGLVFMLEPGFEAQIRPRSGLALKNGVTVLNTPGTVDADYRGEVQVILINLGSVPFEITRGMRIAQCVIAPVTQAVIREVTATDETARGAGGFGSTGV